MEKLECLRHLVELSVINNAVGKGFTCRLSSDFLCLLFGDSGFAWNHGLTEFIASLHSVWLKFIWSHYASLSSYQTPITTKHSSQMSGMRKGSTVAARAPISREFSKENGDTRNFKGKHKNQLLYCKVNEGIKFMTICKRKQKKKKRKTGDLSDSKVIQVQVSCNFVPRVSHLPAPWSSRGREDERPWERGWVSCWCPYLFRALPKKVIGF